ncbi:MAG: superoxide dismutase, Ni [Candidatus Levybacteria bacterium]|nr:superoxide dismutase, Ni [Candidatus Levybacteria bacterium]
MNAMSYILNLIPLKTAYAHCDIPCGVYDPTPAQIAAHTVLRMTQMLEEVSASSKEPPFDERKRIISQIARLTKVKEEHGRLAEEELGTLDNDYFKPEHHKEFPELKELISNAVKLSIKTRQEIDTEAAQKLLETTQKIAEIFYKTKDFEPVRIPSGYPTEGEIVSHK